MYLGPHLTGLLGQMLATPKARAEVKAKAAPSEGGKRAGLREGAGRSTADLRPV